MSTRRKLVIALGAGALVAPLTPFSQQPGKVWRIGICGNGVNVTGLTSMTTDEGTSRSTEAS